MPLTSSSNASLCSSPSLSKPRFHFSRHHSTKLSQSLSPQLYISCTDLPNNSIFAIGASPATESQPSKSEGEGEDNFEEYEVVIEKPYGLKFMKGRDGGTYIDAIAPGSSADKAGVFSVGDRVLATSAVFGEEIWPAAEYGRTMYTIRQRIGPLLMKMERRFGKGDGGGELTEKEIIRAERNSGVISNRVREIQMQNAMRKMEQKQKRAENLREGLNLYKAGKYEEALEKFESVLGLKPEGDEISVASYNVACCYSKLNQLQAGLSALEDAMKAGFEDFKVNVLWTEILGFSVGKLSLALHENIISVTVPLYYHKSDAYLESSEKTHLLASSDSKMTKDPSLVYREMQLGKDRWRIVPKY